MCSELPIAQARNRPLWRTASRRMRTITTTCVLFLSRIRAALSFLQLWPPQNWPVVRAAAIVDAPHVRESPCAFLRGILTRISFFFAYAPSEIRTPTPKDPRKTPQGRAIRCCRIPKLWLLKTSSSFELLKLRAAVSLLRPCSTLYVAEFPFHRPSKPAMMQAEIIALRHQLIVVQRTQKIKRLIPGLPGAEMESHFRD